MRNNAVVGTPASPTSQASRELCGSVASTMFYGMCVTALGEVFVLAATGADASAVLTPSTVIAGVAVMVPLAVGLVRGAMALRRNVRQACQS